MNKRILVMSLICFVLFALLVSCGDSRNAVSDSDKVVAVAKGTFTDSRDGQIYKTVTIGKHLWMAENLNYETQDSYCYGNDEVGCVKYGRLYSLKAAKKACPENWRLPTSIDWHLLIYWVGGEAIAGKMLKSSDSWLADGNGSDDYGFSVLPSGVRYKDGDYSIDGRYAFFWSSTELYQHAAYSVGFNYYNDEASLAVAGDQWFAVRCVREVEDSVPQQDNLSSSSESVEMLSASSSSPAKIQSGSRIDGNWLTDLRDNQVYKIVKIGSQTWMAENLNYETANSSCDLKTCTESGRFYTWDAAMNACPDGWHLPTYGEWKTLITYVGGGVVAGKLLRGKASGMGGTRMRGPFTEFFKVNGIDEFGFLALSPNYWSSSEDDSLSAYHINMPSDDGSASMNRTPKSNIMKVRCLMGNIQRETRLGKLADQNKSVVISGSSSSVIPATKPESHHSFMTDSRDGKTYKTVTIGSQTWMAENLKYESENTYCYDNDTINCSKYGLLYGWSVAKKVCPMGWHLPTLDEWDELLVTAGGLLAADIALRSKTTDWLDSGIRTDEFGFSALPGGFKDADKYKRSGYCADFWTSTDCAPEQKCMQPNFWTSGECASKRKCMRTISLLKGKVDRYHSLENDASSIRCLKDTPRQKKHVVKSRVKDALVDSRDGQAYRTVKIGSKTWMAENLNYKKEGSFCYRNDEDYCSHYGRLYKRGAASGACPVGWHMPSIKEWEELFVTIGNRQVAAKALRSPMGWRNSVAGTDEFGFSALPAGYGKADGWVENAGLGAYWWSSTREKYNSDRNETVALKNDTLEWDYMSDENRLSIRCVKDDTLEVVRKVVKAKPLKDSRDGHTYKTVQIGSLVWMAENLNYKTENSTCHGDSVETCSKYGRFYTWNEAVDCEDKWMDEDGDGWGYTKWCALKDPVQGVCPDGWHMPSLREWANLIYAVGGEYVANNALRSKKGWFGENNGTDDFGFSAIPVVYNKSYNGEFYEKNNDANFWSSTDYEGETEAYRFGLPSGGFYRALNSYRDSYIHISNKVNLSKMHKSERLSVRCVKDYYASREKTVAPASVSSSSSVSQVHVDGTLVDPRDGHAYNTVTIGRQTWMAQNLNYEVKNSSCVGDSAENCAKYGRYYSWLLAKEVCPDGWRMPMQEDWDTLFVAVGGNNVAGKALRSQTGWFGNGNGQDAYGFSALPIRVADKDVIVSRHGSPWMTKEGRNAFFWTFTEQDKDKAYAVYTLYYTDSASYGIIEKKSEFPLRCIKGELADGSKKKMIKAESLTDSRDGQTYKTIEIGTQTWMAENLNYKTDSSFCFNNADSNCVKYGRYYNWATAMEGEGVCPAGWHLPSLVEWNVLIYALGGNDSAGKALKSVPGWNSVILGSDDYGFSALPAGNFSIDDKGDRKFKNEDYSWRLSNYRFANYWSSTEYDDKRAYGINLYGSDNHVNLGTDDKIRSGKSIRCVKDDKKFNKIIAKDESREKRLPFFPDSMNLLVDSRDGQVYKIVSIGSQTWMAENLNFKSEASGCESGFASNCAKYGRRYSWASAMDSTGTYSKDGEGCGYKSSCISTKAVQGLCPDGWHLPTSDEWITLLGTLKKQPSLKSDFVYTDNHRYGNTDRLRLWSATQDDGYKAHGVLFNDERQKDNVTKYEKNHSYGIRCVKNDLPKESAIRDSMVDSRDGQIYKTVTIGSQTWMAENMNFKTENSFCNDNNPASCNSEGRLYKWNALKEVCPAGWHLPTDAEWDTLFTAVGGSSVAGKLLRSKSGWHYCDSNLGFYGNGNGTDEFGFSVLPVGAFYGGGIETYKPGYKACFHTAEKDDYSMEVEMCFNFCSDSVERTDDFTYKEISVRCVKDDAKRKGNGDKRKNAAHIVSPSSVIKGSFTDSRDGRTYKIVKIGKQTWMAQNLNYKTKLSRCLDDEPRRCDDFGRIYQWIDAHGACPVGWHLPTEKDWNTLINAVGDSATAARALKSKEGWLEYKDRNGGGSDDYGFTAEPVGCWVTFDAMLKDGTFSENGYSANFWTSKEHSADSAYVMGMGYFDGDVIKFEDAKANGYTVRCVKDY